MVATCAAVGGSGARRCRRQHWRRNAAEDDGVITRIAPPSLEHLKADRCGSGFLHRPLLLLTQRSRRQQSGDGKKSGCFHRPVGTALWCFINLVGRGQRKRTKENFLPGEVSRQPQRLTPALFLPIAQPPFQDLQNEQQLNIRQCAQSILDLVGRHRINVPTSLLQMKNQINLPPALALAKQAQLRPQQIEFTFGRLR